MQPVCSTCDIQSPRSPCFAYSYVEKGKSNSLNVSVFSLRLSDEQHGTTHQCLDVTHTLWSEVCWHHDACQNSEITWPQCVKEKILQRKITSRKSIIGMLRYIVSSMFCTEAHWGQFNKKYFFIAFNRNNYCVVTQSFAFNGNNYCD
jgi:hypothetical protein